MKKITSFFVDDCISVQGKQHIFVRFDVGNATTPEQIQAIPCELFVQCVQCGSNYDLGVVRKGDLTRWLKGALIQNVFPQFDADTREMMSSGTCPVCFEKMFGEEE